MEGTGIQPVMNVGNGYGYGDNFGFGGSGIWLFAILALMWGGNGVFGRNCGSENRCATVEDLNNSLGGSFANAMIGNSETNGFAYSLRDFGATDFDFEKIGDKIYFVIKK